MKNQLRELITSLTAKTTVASVIEAPRQLLAFTSDMDAQAVNRTIFSLEGQPQKIREEQFQVELNQKIVELTSVSSKTNEVMSHFQASLEKNYRLGELLAK